VPPKGFCALAGAALWAELGSADAVALRRQERDSRRVVRTGRCMAWSVVLAGDADVRAGWMDVGKPDFEKDRQLLNEWE
jgi:hypothetical protein